MRLLMLVNPGEVVNCHANANCLEDAIKPSQRQLQPDGWTSAKGFADAFRDMGIPIDKEYSSPFTRCAKHAKVFSDTANEERLELLYMGPWKGVLELNGNR
jgi:phosphohistidine phosphatase SixA